jgi:hypothetical protein
MNTKGFLRLGVSLDKATRLAVEFILDLMPLPEVQ